MQKFLALFLTFSLLVQMILPVAAFAQTTETFARITANSLNVRSGPATSFDAIDKVTRGMELFTLRQESGSERNHNCLCPCHGKNDCR